MNEFQVGQLVWSEQDKAEVTVELVYASTKEARVRGVVASWRDLSTLTPLEPRAGDVVRVTAISQYDKFPSHKVGDEVTTDREFCRVTEAGNACESGDWWCLIGRGNGGTWCKVILLRRASTPEVKERKF